MNAKILSCKYRQNTRLIRISPNKLLQKRFIHKNNNARSMHKQTNKLQKRYIHKKYLLNKTIMHDKYKVQDIVHPLNTKKKIGKLITNIDIDKKHYTYDKEGKFHQFYNWFRNDLIYTDEILSIGIDPNKPQEESISMPKRLLRGRKDPFVRKLFGLDKDPNVPKSVDKVDWESIGNPDKEVIQTTWVGHATTLVQMDGLNIITDPIFSDRPSPVSFIGPKRLIDPPFTIDELFQHIPQMDIVLISHNHYDHVDKRSIKRLKDKTKYWFVPKNVKPLIESFGVESDRIVELDWQDEFHFENSALYEEEVENENGGIKDVKNENGSTNDVNKNGNTKDIKNGNTKDIKNKNGNTKDIKDKNGNTKDIKNENGESNSVKVAFAEAMHFSGRSLTDNNQTLWGSWYIKGKSGKTFYFAGDGGYRPIPKFWDNDEKHRILPAVDFYKDIGDRYGGVDVSTIPIGATSPKHMMSAVHMNPIDAIDCALDIKSKHNVPIHFDTFPLTLEPIFESETVLRNELERRKLGTLFDVLKVGESKKYKV